MQNALRQTRSRDQMLDYLFQNPIEDQFEILQELKDLTQDSFSLTRWFGGLFGR